MRKGFTVIEVLIVVAIVAIIAAIVIPGVTQKPKPSKPQEYKTQVEKHEGWEAVVTSPDGDTLYMQYTRGYVVWWSAKGGFRVTR